MSFRSNRALECALGAVLSIITATATAGTPDSSSAALGTAAGTSDFAVTAGAAANAPTTTLEEITVTATRRSESSERVPVSIQALSQADLTQAGIKTFDDLALASPGFQMERSQNIPSTINTLAIRTINSSTGQSPVGLYYEGAPLTTRLSGPTNFGVPTPVVFDMERVEVDRGPQGTLFGAGAEAGAVALFPVAPSLTTYSGYTHSEVGAIDHGGDNFEAQGAIGGPIDPERIGFRVSVYDRHDGGYVDRYDIVSNQRTETAANTQDTVSLRGALAFKAGDSILITPALLLQVERRGDGGRFTDQFSSLSNGQFAVGTLVNTRLIPETSHDRVVLPTLNAKATLPFADLTGTVSYIDRKGYTKQDQSSSPPAGGLVPGLVSTWGSPYGTLYPVSQLDLNEAHYDQKLHGATAEVHLASSNAQSFVSWVVGAFYDHLSQTDYEHQVDQAVDGNVPILLVSQDVVDEQFAAYANLDFHVTSKLTASLGDRVSHSTVSMLELNGNTLQSGPMVGEPAVFAPSSLKENPTTPRVSVSYQASRDNMFYAAVSKGFRLGGFNSAVPDTCSGFQPVYKSDYIWNYEAGEKSRFFDQRLQLDYSVFHDVWYNIEQLNFLPCQFSYTFNGGQAKVDGLELGLQALATDHLRVFLNAAYGDGRFTEAVNAGDGTPLVKPGVAIGPAPQVAAPWNVTAAVDYTFPLPNGDSLLLRADGTYKSHNSRGLVTDIKGSDNYYPLIVADPAYHLFNLRATYTHDDMDFGLFVDNVANAQPVLQTFQESNAPGNNFSMSRTLTPRTVGLSFNYTVH